MVRLATLADVPEVVRLLQTMAEKYGEDELDAHAAEAIVTMSIQNNLCFVSCHYEQLSGVILGLVVKHPFLKITVLQEIAWYSERGYGVSLLSEFIRRGETLGVDAITASTLTRNTRAETLMDAHGFKSAEVAWIKRME